MAFLERFRRRADGQYWSLPAEEDEPDTPIKSTHNILQGGNNERRWKSMVSHIMCALLGMVLLFAWGHRSSVWLFKEDYIPPSGNTPQIWYENHTFTGTPSASTQHAWEALIPKGKGFVSHPQLASPPKAVAAYHQIHCLHGIRIAYYTRVNELHKVQGKHSLVNHYIESMGANVHLYHLDHCFEYLRQALMCAADSNLEDLVVDAKGRAEAPGWGTQRICRDFEQLGKWSRKWRASEDETIL